MTKLLRLDVNCYISKEVTDSCFDGYADFLNAPHQNKFIHLLGDFKREEQSCLKLARRLRNDCPEYYYRIITECKKAKVKLHLSCYNSLPEPFDGNSSGVLNNTLDFKDTIDFDFWRALYTKGKILFKLMDERFANIELLSKTYFTLNDQVEFEMSLKNVVYGDDLNGKAPFCFLMKYIDLNLDTLDQVLVDILKNKLSFEDILSEVKLYFDDEEIDGNYDVFVRLISGRLKMGVEENLFVINV